MTINYNKYALAYNVATASKIEVYGLNYNVNWMELHLRQLTVRALIEDDTAGVLTEDEHDSLASKMNEPFNN